MRPLFELNKNIFWRNFWSFFIFKPFYRNDLSEVLYTIHQMVRKRLEVWRWGELLPHSGWFSEWPLIGDFSTKPLNCAKLTLLAYKPEGCTMQIILSSNFDDIIPIIRFIRRVKCLALQYEVSVCCFNQEEDFYELKQSWIWLTCAPTLPCEIDRYVILW